MSTLDNAIKKILDSTSLEERMASIARVCDVDKWEDGEYHGNATEVAHILAKEVKRWLDSDTAPLFKEEEPPTVPKPICRLTARPASCICRYQCGDNIEGHAS